MSRSETIRQLWKTPEYREKAILGMKKGKPHGPISAEHIAKLSKRSRTEVQAFEKLKASSPYPIFHPSSICDAIQILPNGSIYLIELKSPIDELTDKQKLAQSLTPGKYVVQKFTESGELS